MDLKGISEKAGESKVVLDATRQKTDQAKKEAQQVGEILRRVHEKEAPFVTYARDLIALSAPKIRASSFYGSVLDNRRPTSPRTSPLVRVGNEGKHKQYFVSARENYVETDYDGDGNPRGETFTGFSFVASIGMNLTLEEYYALPAVDRDKLTHLGETLKGEPVYGSVISTESFADPRKQFSTAQLAHAYEETAGEVLANVGETVELLRSSLADEGLNPSDIPRALL